MRWALHQHPKGADRVAPSAAKLVLVVLADHTSAGLLAWPSEQTVADRALIHRRQVRRVLRSLEAEGLILDTGRRHRHGTIIWALPVESLGTTGGNRPPLGEGLRSNREGLVSNGGGLRDTQGGPQAPRSSHEPPMNPPGSTPSSAEETGTPSPAGVPAKLRRAVYGAAKRIPEGPLTAEQLEARRREQLERLGPLVQAELAAQEREQPDG